MKSCRQAPYQGTQKDLKQKFYSQFSSLSSNDLDLEKNESPSEWEGGGGKQPREHVSWNIGIIQECS